VNDNLIYGGASVDSAGIALTSTASIEPSRCRRARFNSKARAHREWRPGDALIADRVRRQFTWIVVSPATLRLSASQSSFDPSIVTVDAKKSSRVEMKGRSGPHGRLDANRPVLILERGANHRHPHPAA
jgi:hypothetical protein